MRQVKVDRDKISDRHMMLVDKYFELNCDKTAAAKAAGYKHANGYVSRLFSHPHVVAEIAVRHARLRAKVEVDEAWLIERFAAIADAGRTLAKFKVVEGDGTLRWDFTGATEAELALISELSVDFYTEGRGDDAREVKKFRVGVPEPKGALDSLARHLGFFNDKLEVNLEKSLVDRLQAGRKRVPPKGK